MTHSTTAAAILWGGQARRFAGRDKSRLVVEGRPIIVRQLEVLRRVASEVFVVGRRDGEPPDPGLTVHDDIIPGAGALGGIHTALEVARAGQVLVVACDLPFLDARVLQELVRLAAGADGAWVRTARGPEPLLACYQRSARGAIRDAILAGRLKAGDLGAVLRIAELDAAALERFGPVDRLLANLNTPDDHARMR
jgi:molybdopterin-guanine dinucleotide biosynthesis protein A